MKIIIKRITFKNIGVLGIHYSGLYSDLNSFFSEWIFGKRYGKLILDLRYSFIEWKKTIYFLSNIIAIRGKVLYADQLYHIEEYNSTLKYFFLLGQFFINSIFSGGLISNFKYIYLEIIKIFFDQTKLNNDFFNSKKNNFYKENLIGLKNLRRPPNVIFTPDGERNFWLVKSSVQIKLPTISLTNPCFFVNGLFLSIPGSTQQINSIPYFVFILINIFLKGLLNELRIFFILIKKNKKIKLKKKRKIFKKYKKLLNYKKKYQKKFNKRKKFNKKYN
jgi:ribosomal protein S2